MTENIKVTIYPSKHKLILETTLYPDTKHNTTPYLAKCAICVSHPLIMQNLKIIAAESEIDILA